MRFKIKDIPPEGLVVSQPIADGLLRDAFAGTPWHKHVPARIEPLP